MVLALIQDRFQIKAKPLRKWHDGKEHLSGVFAPNFLQLVNLHLYEIETQ
jgi:hypothetical protein